MAQNRAKRLSGINTLAYLGIEPITAPLLIVKYNNETPTTLDRVGNQIGAVWISMDTAAGANNAKIFFLTRLDGSGSSGVATWTEMQTGAVGPGLDFLSTDDGNTAIPLGGNINVVGGLTDRGGISAQNITTYNDPAGSNFVFIALQNSIFLPNTTDINDGVIGFGGTADVNRFIHNFGTNNTFVGGAAGNFTLSGQGNVGLGTATLTDLATGNDVVAVGHGAGSAINSGTESVYIGSFAGATLTAADGNVCVGYQAMTATPGNSSSNVAIGWNCMATGGAHSSAVAMGYNASNAGSLNTSVVIGFRANETGVGTQTGSVIIGSRSGLNLNSSNQVVAIGIGTLQNGVNLSGDIAIGANALQNATSGTPNIAIGSNAGSSITTGTTNTLVGTAAGSAMQGGGGNCAFGVSALNSYVGDTIDNNIAIGPRSLNLVVQCNDNIAIGADSMALNASTSTDGRGSSNIAIGDRSLLALNPAGANQSQYNIGIGVQSGFNATIANQNIFIGRLSGTAIVTGNSNIGIGTSSLGSGGAVSGSFNVSIGDSSGTSYTTTESSNILINTTGTVGDNNTMRIGSGTGAGNKQLNKTFISGIRGITTTNADAVAVLIDSANQLGTVSSSRRFKENIRDMSDDSSAVMNLRPVTFTYKSDDQKRLQYGLIAEEVEEVMQRLVVYGEDGLPQSVRYNDLPQILLNEVQKLEKRVKDLEKAYSCTSCKH